MIPASRKQLQNLQLKRKEFCFLYCVIVSDKRVKAVVVFGQNTSVSVLLERPSTRADTTPVSVNTELVVSLYLGILVTLKTKFILQNPLT